MEHTFKKPRLIALILTVALLLAALPCFAAAEGSFSALVKEKYMLVYPDQTLSAAVGALPNKTIVTVQSYSGDVAKISYKGKTGYAKVSDMQAVSSVAKAATTSTKTFIFKKPNLTSSYAKVAAGTSLNVLAVNGSCAMVERNGYVGYAYAGHLTYDGVVPEPVIDTPVKDEQEMTEARLEELRKQLEAKKESIAEESKEMTLAQMLESGKYSNEQLIFIFAMKVLGYNAAAASGLVANIKYESGFKTTSNGDGGTSYGICQWHAARKTRLINYCSEHNLDHTTLAGQLYYLQYELEKFYPSVHRYMKNVDDSAEGAYDAAYYFCYNFEAPANRASKSTTRGNYAQNTVYPKYTKGTAA